MTVYLNGRPCLTAAELEIERAEIAGYDFLKEERFRKKWPRIHIIWQFFLRFLSVFSVSNGPPPIPPDRDVP